MNKVEEERYRVEIDLASNLIDQKLEPTVVNQIIVLREMYTKAEGVIRESLNREPTHYTDLLREAGMLRMIYINRLIGKLGKILH